MTRRKYPLECLTLLELHVGRLNRHFRASENPELLGILGFRLPQATASVAALKFQ